MLVFLEFNASFQGFSHIFLKKNNNQKIKIRSGNPHTVVSQCLINTSGYVKQM